MAVSVLVCATPRELEGIVSRLATREDFIPVPCGSGRAALDALSRDAATLGAAVVHMSLPDVDGTDVARRIRAAAPTCRIVMLAQDDQPWHRDACFRAGCDDVAFIPDQLDEVGTRLAGGDEAAFRRAARVPVSLPVFLRLPSGEVETQAESLSIHALRVTWRMASPGRIVVPLRMTFPETGEMTLWGRLEDVASRKGEPEALIVRFLGLTSAERNALQDIVGERRVSRESSLRLEAVPDAVRYEGVPDVPAPPPTAAPAAPPRRSRGARIAGLVVLAVLLTGGSALAVREWIAFRGMQRPSSAYVARPSEIVEGLQLRFTTTMGTRFIVVADASWTDLDAEERGRALAALHDKAVEKGLERTEVYDSLGLAATVETRPDADPDAQILR